nr:GTP cyclohydrolase FolE2 [Luteibacter jiangsuensis]
MPDVATQTAPRFGAPLEWVGMDGIDAPIRFDAGDGAPQVAAAKIGAFVNLARPDVRGIHMSRLYLMVDEYLGSRTLDAGTLDAMLRAFLDSHAGLADRARVDIRFQHLVRRRALRSDNSGWRAYPVAIEATRDARGFHLGLTTEVTYSSTCPASAALARQLIQERFATDFAADAPLDRAAVLAWLGSEQGIVATPHAQRSVARLQVRYAAGATPNLIGLLDAVEGALGTPAQTAVKREDEQAFALANGGNLMFCEDAARRIQRVLDGDAGLAGFQVRLEHQESLHAHDAVAFTST